MRDDGLAENKKFLDLLPQIVGMICRRRKYSNKYSMVKRVCNMSLVSPGKVLNVCAPWARINPPSFHFPLPDLAGIPESKRF